MLTDIEIANLKKPKNITKIASLLNIKPSQVELYGKYKAKINAFGNKKGKIILVTAINPTPLGEGKTTISIGLADAIKRLGKNVCLALREPSLGPVFGIKGGAAGGGYSQVVPMEDINLHFTGDLHAITCANNLLCAMIDNHIFSGNALNIDKNKIYFRRCMDMNDRALRNITVGRDNLGAPLGESARADGFDITAASEVMAVFCLARDLNDLKQRLGNIIIGVNASGGYVYAKDLKAQGAMAAVLKDAVKPNLVQTLEGTPALIHGGPFANIAHGCNSVIATKTAMSLAGYVVTEAGFGADLGAEKFMDVKCRIAGIEPSCVVIVATVKALKLHGGALKTELAKEDVERLKSGMANLLKHINNIDKVFNKNIVVAVNRYASDTDAELNLIKSGCAEIGVKAVFTEVYARGGEGGTELAEEVLKASEKPRELKFAYELSDGIKTKINKIVTKIYGGDGAEFSEAALEKIAAIEKEGYGGLPVIIAKTQYSLSDNKDLLAAPKGFKIFVRDINLRAGAGFIVAAAGDIMLMPGLSKSPSAERIDVDGEGKVTGLF